MSGMRVLGNFPVTDPLRDYANQKLSKPLETFSGLVTGEPEVNSLSQPCHACPCIRINVVVAPHVWQLHLKVESRAVHDIEHKGKEAHIAEVTVFCVDKQVITAKSESDDMYASIDDLSDTLMRRMRKLKEKRIDVKETRKRSAKDELVDALEDDE